MSNNEDFLPDYEYNDEPLVAGEETKGEAAGQAGAGKKYEIIIAGGSSKLNI